MKVREYLYPVAGKRYAKNTSCAPLMAGRIAVDAQSP